MRSIPGDGTRRDTLPKAAVFESFRRALRQGGRGPSLAAPVPGASDRTASAAWPRPASVAGVIAASAFPAAAEAAARKAVRRTGRPAPRAGDGHAGPPELVCARLPEKRPPGRADARARPRVVWKGHPILAGGGPYEGWPFRGLSGRRERTPFDAFRGRVRDPRSRKASHRRRGVVAGRRRPASSRPGTRSSPGFRGRVAPRVAGGKAGPGPRMTHDEPTPPGGPPRSRRRGQRPAGSRSRTATSCGAASRPTSSARAATAAARCSSSRWGRGRRPRCWRRPTR